MKFISLNELPFESVSHDPAIQKKVILRRGEIPPLTSFSQAVFEPGQVASCHAHSDMHEIFFVVSGSGVIRLDERQFALLAGSCAVAEPGEKHEIINTGLHPLVLLYFGVETNIKL